jgi:hypothetical protein
MNYRVSGVLVGLLMAAAVIGLGYLGLLAVQAHNRSVDAASYRQGEHALQALALPHGVVDVADAKTGGLPFGCKTQPDTRCLHATVDTDDVDPLLHRLLSVTRDECTSVLTQCSVYGQLDGHGAFAVAFPHNDQTYVGGTDITLGLTSK